MKQSVKAQELKLPLIQQKYSHSNKPSKSSTKRSNFAHNLSQLHYSEKQKNLPKLSKFIDHPTKKPKQLNKSMEPKKLNKTYGDAELSSESDFQEKIKQNKILLKKHQLKKELEKRTRSISKQLNKQNLPDLDRLPQIKSKKVILPKLKNKKFISFLANKNSEEWVRTIMEGAKINPIEGNKLSRTKSNGLLPKVHIHEKLSGSDVFENIHLFLKSLQTEIPSNEKATIPKDEIYGRILKYKNQLRKMEPNSQFLKSLDERIEKKRSVSKRKNKGHEESVDGNRLRYMTSSEWGKVTMDRQDCRFLASTFEEQIEKVNTYLSKTSWCLEELLKNRMSIIDLIVLRKLKAREIEKNVKLGQK